MHYSDDEIEAWLADCPFWCEGIQCKSPLPADRHHQSAASKFPAVAFSTVYDELQGELRELVGSTDVDLVVNQRHPGDYLWVSVGTEDRAIEISLESARRLHQKLGSLLAFVGAPAL